MLKTIPRRNHITPVLKDLHWLNINEKIEFKILILTYRTFYETGPIYLRELIKKHNSSNRTRRANDHCLLSIPPISKMCANSYFERSFSYAAPFLWNRLDISIRMLNFDHFKSRIKTELYLRYFKLNVCVFSQYENNLYRIGSLIVSTNQLAMCTGIIIAVLIYHDVIIQILPSISMWLDTHIGMNRPYFLTYYFIFHVICSV